MTQLNEEQNTQEIISPDDNLPAEQSGAFIEIGNQKVQLDIEDAPFLAKEEPEPSGEVVPVTEAAVATVAKEGEAEEPKSKKKLILIIGLALILLIAAAVGVFLFLGAEEEVIIPQNIITVPTPPEEIVLPFHQIILDPFWIDLKNDGSGAKFLVGTFIISMDTLSVKDEIEKNMKIVRDAIYYYLVNAGADFLINVKNTEKIRAGMSEILGQYVLSGPITDIYFDSFLMK